MVRAGFEELVRFKALRHATREGRNFRKAMVRYLHYLAPMRW
jgi:hypothetical protein